MSLLVACFLAVVTAILAAVAAAILKGFLRVKGEESTFLLGLGVSALISSLCVGGGIAYGRINPGLWPNVGVGAVIWIISSIVLTGWGCMSLGMEAGDALKRVVLYAALIAFLTAAWLGLAQPKAGAPVRAAMKLANGVNEWIFKQIQPRFFPDVKW